MTDCSIDHDHPILQALKPAVDLETAVDLAKAVWGLCPDGIHKPKPLDSYDDNNFYMVSIHVLVNQMRPSIKSLTPLGNSSQASCKARASPVNTYSKSIMA